LVVLNRGQSYSDNGAAQWDSFRETSAMLIIIFMQPREIKATACDQRRRHDDDGCLRAGLRSGQVKLKSGQVKLRL
jgi:hypothetical protein